MHLMAVMVILPVFHIFINQIGCSLPHFTYFEKRFKTNQSKEDVYDIKVSGENRTLAYM